MDKNENETVSPFANGSNYMLWMTLNCYQCQKYKQEESVYDSCEIELNLAYGSVTDGTIPKDIAKRMGMLDHPVNEIYRCHEFKVKVNQG